ncbi:hypothetical protein BJY52DRAFT_1120940 [Lactarius psammicola]|nr:hypothetical protein BJY52DRAFT_1120940 [Lactarius psammicola]
MTRVPSRLIAQCAEFLTRGKIVNPSEFFSNKPHEYAPQFIVVWIMNECDELNVNGTRRLSTQVRATYGTAQKMRASMTYAFGRIHGLGSMHWQRGSDGRMVGNPSVSEVVSRYMLSLHRRKVQAGETATSVRAISPETLLKLYHFNSRVELRDLRDYAPGKKWKVHNEWGGARARRLLELAFTVAFTCLLRVDEVLKIQSQDFILLGDDRLQLTLPFRKTSQFGDIKPFVLHKLPDSMAHLCPVRAYAEWLVVSRISDGYVFRRLGSGDRVSENNQPMVCAACLEKAATPYGPLTCSVDG